MELGICLPNRLELPPWRVFAEVFAKRDFGLALVWMLESILGMEKRMCYLLSNLLVAVCAELGCAWAHDGVGGRDV